MFQVYLLYSEKFNKIYIGFSSNLIERLKSHNELGTKGYTVKFRPWELIYTETFSEKNLALKREKELKTSRGRAFCWSEVEKYMSNKSLGSYQSKD
ncbi:MAG: GIY-YIG nuclease family protein [Flavobacteriia bacterium]